MQRLLQRTKPLGRCENTRKLRRKIAQVRIRSGKQTLLSTELISKALIVSVQRIVVSGSGYRLYAVQWHDSLHDIQLCAKETSSLDRQDTFDRRTCPKKDYWFVRYVETIRSAIQNSSSYQVYREAFRLATGSVSFALCNVFLVPWEVYAKGNWIKEDFIQDFFVMKPSNYLNRAILWSFASHLQLDLMTCFCRKKTQSGVEVLDSPTSESASLAATTPRSIPGLGQCTFETSRKRRTFAAARSFTSNGYSPRRIACA